MSLLPIKLVGHPALRSRAKKVARLDRSVQKLLDDMLETMREAPGLGLAANQVGSLQRLVVVELDDQVYQLVNPEIVHSEGEQVGEEGCLSLPGYYGDVRRAAQVVVHARNRNGKELRIPAEGLLAVIFQHEIDHLDGTLFVDRLVSVDTLRYTAVKSEPQEVRL